MIPCCITQDSLQAPLELYEFHPRSLILDSKTLGVGHAVEIVEIDLCDFEGSVIFDSLVRPAYNQPRSFKEQQFGRSEYDAAPD